MGADYLKSKDNKDMISQEDIWMLLMEIKNLQMIFLNINFFHMKILIK